MYKLPTGITVVAVMPFMLIIMIISQTKSQGDEEDIPSVTAEMFAILQAEVESLYAQMANLQDQLQGLATNIQNLAADTAVGGTIELAELQALIEVSNKQEEDLIKLTYSNGLWQQNFRVINNTFAKLRKVVVFPIPVLNNLPQSPVAVKRILPSLKPRQNITLTWATTPIPKLKRNQTNKAKKIYSIKKN